MTRRFSINSTTPLTKDWTSKVQVVDKYPVKINKDGIKKYPLLLLQDEEVILLLLISIKLIFMYLINYCNTLYSTFFYYCKIQKNQVQTVIQNIDIPHFEKHLKSFKTYFVSAAQVKESNLGYANPFNAYAWMIDKTTIIEPIDKVIPPKIHYHCLPIWLQFLLMLLISK